MVTSALCGAWPSSTGLELVGGAPGRPRIHQGHGDVRHAERLAVAGAGENHVFHAGAAQAFGRLFAQHPTDGIADIGLAAAVGADNGGDAFPVEAQFGALAKGLESLQFYAF